MVAMKVMAGAMTSSPGLQTGVLKAISKPAVALVTKSSCVGS